MTNRSFSFVLFNTDKKDVQTRVTVYRARQTNDQIIYTSHQAQFKPNKQETSELFRKLRPGLLWSPAGNTLVRIGRHLRIDSQNISHGLMDRGVWRNIHIQNGSLDEQLSSSVVKIGQGCQLCYSPDPDHIGYKHMLLKYLKGGLLESRENAMKYEIPVRIETRKKNDSRDKYTDWREVPKTEKNMNDLQKEIDKRLKVRRRLKAEYRMNLARIAQASTMIEQVVAEIEKNLIKLSEKEGAHIKETNIPVVSIFVGIFCRAEKLEKGSIADTIAVIATDVLDEIPGLSDSSSAAFVAFVAMDIAKVVKNEKEHRRLTEHEIEDLKIENKKIKSEMDDFLQNSPIFGEGTYDKFFDESEIAYIDDISKIHIRSSDFIDGIQIEYKLGGKSAYHGGQGGTLKTLVLDPNEKITTVEISTYQGAVCSLVFCTDLGRRLEFGEVHVHEDVKTNMFELADGYYLAAIKGYDMFKNENGEATKTCPTLPGNREVLPAIGFTATF